MIRIVRGRTPSVLLHKGKDACRSDCAAFDGGARGFDFKRTIYADATVKNALRRAQHDKCCFCESKVSHVAHGDVEHFRPKARCRQSRGGSPLPGYYWLAYEWTNLLYCCQVCNQRGKGDLFPLRDPGNRAASHHDDLHKEEPLFLNPAAEDPSEHIEFRDEQARPKKRSPKGRLTIQALGLNRTELRHQRLKYLRLLRQIKSDRDLIDQLVREDEAAGKKPRQEERRHLAELDLLLSESQQDDAQFAAMARDFLRGAARPTT